MPEMLIYQLCDGILPQAKRADVEAHCAYCRRCNRIRNEARQSLALLQQESPHVSFLEEKRTSAIIATALTDSQRKPKILDFSSTTRSFRILAAAAVLVIAAISLIAIHPDVLHQRLRGGALSESNVEFGEHTIVTARRDTTVVFQKTCALQVIGNSAVRIRQPSPRVVDCVLDVGSVLVAAHKGHYDTICIRCGPVSVFATGTHFAVDRNAGEVRVSVVEGVVQVQNSQTKSRSFVGSGELCIANNISGTLCTQAMSQSLSGQLAEKFETLGLSEIPLASSGKPSLQSKPRSSARNDAEAQLSFAAARHLVRAGRYDAATIALVDYLSNFSSDRDVAYCDLALCYSRQCKWESAVEAYMHAMRATDDSLVAEAVLHRSNSILFSKLGRLSEAEQDIRRYLAEFPIGAWREREFGMLLKIEIAQKRSADAKQTVESYRLEFPAASGIEEIDEQLARMCPDPAGKTTPVGIP